MLLRAGYSYVPCSSLESVIEQSKEGYYLALRQTQVTIRTVAPNWQPWVLFFLRALQQQQMKRLAKKVEREKIGLAALPALSMRIIIEHACEHGRVTISDEADGHEQEHIEAAFPPAGRPTASCPPRQRARCVVRIALIQIKTPADAEFLHPIVGLPTRRSLLDSSLEVLPRNTYDQI